MKRSLNALVFAALVYLSVLPAHAIPVRWTLVDAVFDDGGTITGSFIYDADIGGLGQYSNISVTTAGGTVYPGNTYDVVITGTDGLVDLSDLERTDYSDTVDLVLWFGTSQATIPLTNAGGTVPLLLANTSEATCVNSSCTIRTSPRRTAISGEVVGTVVPIPATVWLFGSALAFLSWVRRRTT